LKVGEGLKSLFNAYNIRLGPGKSQKIFAVASYGLRWEAKRHTALDVSSVSGLTTEESKAVSSLSLCHRSPYIGSSMDSGGKRSATPLWMFHRAGDMFAKNPKQITGCQMACAGNDAG
jgi:hypothetical protein